MSKVFVWETLLSLLIKCTYGALMFCRFKPVMLENIIKERFILIPTIGVNVSKLVRLGIM